MIRDDQHFEHPIIELHRRLLENRIILINEPINDIWCDKIVRDLLYLEDLDPVLGIDIYINCPGGSVAAAIEIYRTMQDLTPVISTICLKRTAGAAVLLLAAGAKGKRFCLKGAHVVLCELCARAQGDEPVKKTQEIVSGIMEKYEVMTELLAKHTGREKLRVYTDLMQGRDLTAEEASDYGIIDGMIDQSRIRL
jgi:ATP-dependent Clp protease, protease subunit